jgi:hypothetical protein
VGSKSVSTVVVVADGANVAGVLPPVVLRVFPVG